MIVVTLTPAETSLLLEELSFVLDSRQQDFLDMSEDPNVSFSEIEKHSEKTKEIRNVYDHIKRKSIH